MVNQKQYLIKENTIIINRELNELDNFVKDFLEILKKHADYLIVSGFVSISTGRTRGTEDIDVLVPTMEKEKFKKLFEDLVKGKFWCYQGEEAEKIYQEYIMKKNNIRFSRVDEIFPNIEFIPIDKSRKAKFFEFSHPQKIRFGNFEFKIPPIEFEILYKEIILGGKKDIADAKHLRTFFSDLISEEKFKEYERVIKEDSENEKTSNWFRLCLFLC